MDQYLKNGAEIFKNFCSSTNNQPMMLPRAPDQTYIDLYPVKDNPQSTSNFGEERQHQSDYEAEVVVYRALEGRDGNVIVLHNFEFTHHQFRLCDKGHVRRGCPKCKGKKAENKEGECDFLIICPELFVVIEVKNMKNVEREFVQCVPDLCTVGEDSQQPERGTMDRQLEALIGTFKKSIEQRNKMVKLIDCIDEGVVTLQFTAYPNFSKAYQGDFGGSGDQSSTIIFKEDWSENVTKSSLIHNNPTSDCQDLLTKHEKIRNMLLAIWSTDKNNFNRAKCSLGHCILDIDKRLKEGLFTFKPKKGKSREHNPGVVEAPDVIRNYIKIENVTAEQYKVFNSEEKLVWISGPAGAGKTVIMCGKIIQLVQSARKIKVVLFRITGEGNNTQVYQRALEKAGVNHEKVITDWDKYTPSELCDYIAESACRVIIVEITRYLPIKEFLGRLSKFENCHLFFDDLQRVMFSITPEQCGVLIDSLLGLSLRKYIWIACDMGQDCYLQNSTKQYLQNVMELSNVITDKLNPNQRVTLSVNLRNTFDLSKVLTIIRDRFIGLISKRSDILDMVLPRQVPGHFIHGPKSVIHILDSYNVKTIGEVLIKELNNLCNVNGLNNSDVGIVFNFLRDNSDILSLVEDIVDKQNENSADKMIACYSRNSYSAEWPAVLVLHKMYELSEGNMSRLYLKISRARVYCSVLVYPEKGKTLEDYGDVLDLLDKMRSHAHIVRHKINTK